MPVFLTGYNLCNVKYDTKFADLDSGKEKAGTKIQGYGLGVDKNNNTKKFGNSNQQWRLDPVPAGKNLYTIRNVGSGTHAGFEGDAAVGTLIAGYGFNTLFELVTVDDSIGTFLIKVPYSSLSWKLKNDTDGTQIELAKFDKSEKDQQWAFKIIA